MDAEDLPRRRRDVEGGKEPSRKVPELQVLSVCTYGGVGMWMCIVLVQERVRQLQREQLGDHSETGEAASG